MTSKNPENNQAAAAPRPFGSKGWPPCGATGSSGPWWGWPCLILLSYLTRWAVCSSGLWDGFCHYYYLLDDKEKVRAYLQAAGPAAPLTFILTQILQVVFAPIPGEATGFIGGFLFGVPLGMLYSTIGLTVGSLMAFLLGRWLEHKFVARVVSKETIDKFDFLMERQGTLIAFFLFVVPGFPKDYLCFILGLSTMSWKLFCCSVHRGPAARHPDAHLAGGRGLRRAITWLTGSCWAFACCWRGPLLLPGAAVPVAAHLA